MRVVPALLLAGTALLGIARDGQEPYKMRPPGTLSFADVAPILSERCSSCHRTGGSAPFTLLDYDHVVKQAPQILSDTANGYMPPTTSRYEGGSFSPHGALPSQEMMLLKQWINEGCKKGEAKPVALLTEAPWAAGKPDRIVSVTPGFLSPAEGHVMWREIALPRLGSCLLRGFEIRPKGPQTLRQLELYRISDVGVRQLVGVWAIGSRSPLLPVGTAFRIKPSDRLVARLRLHATGKDENAGFDCGLYFAKTGDEPSSIELSAVAGKVPANESAFTLERDTTLSEDVSAVAVTPRLGWLGKSCSLVAFPPASKTITLYRNSTWDPAWVLAYRYAKPIPLPKGTRLHARFVFDNSVNNVRNPKDPPAEVPFGEGEFEERARFELQVIRAETPQASARE